MAQSPTQLNSTDHSSPRRTDARGAGLVRSHKMEAVGAVFGIVDVALRTSSKVWKLSGVWRDAPAELHRLRDELDRTERFFSETQHGIESLYALSREHRGESHATWAEVERLLDAGVVVLRRIEDFIDSLERPDSQSIGQPLSKTRRIKWMTSARRTTASREELRGIMTNICNLLIAQNMYVTYLLPMYHPSCWCHHSCWYHCSCCSAADTPRSMSVGTYISIKESHGILAKHLGERIQESHEVAVTRLYTAIQSSQKAILSHVDNRLLQTPERMTSVVSTDSLAKRTRDQEGDVQIRPRQDWYAPQTSINCRCRCHIPDKTAWRLAALRSFLGSAMITFRGQSGRPCNRSLCSGHPKGWPWREVHLIYHLPDWLARASLVTSLSTTSAGNSPQVAFQLRVYNRVAPSYASNSRLNWAIDRGDVDEVRRLLEARCPSFYDLIGDYGRSPLAFAVNERHAEIVKLLLQAGADQYQETQNGGGINTSPIGIAFRYTLTGSPADEAVARLFDLDPFIEECDFKPLHLAIMGTLHLDLSRALQQPQYLSDINYRSLNGLTALEIAVLKNDIKAVQALIWAGVDVNAKDEKTSKCPPLERACLHGRYEVAEMLLRAGASVTDQDYGGWTALFAAAAACVGAPDPKAHARLAKLLLRHGSDLSVRVDGGLVALNWAIAGANREMADILLSHGADINTADDSGFTPLLWTIMDINLPGLETALDSGADLHLRDKTGEGVLHKLATHGTPESIYIFTRTKTKYRLRTLDMSAPNRDGKTPLELLLERNPSKELREAFDELADCVEHVEDWPSECEFDDDEFVDAQESLDEQQPPDYVKESPY